MRVLHVVAERGFAGGENQLLATLTHLRRSDIESVIALNTDARFRPHAEALGLEVHEVGIGNNADLFGAARLRHLFRDLQPDLIHFADSRAHKVGALAGVWSRGLPPRIVTRRMDYPLKSGPYRRWLYGRAVNAVVVISAAVRDVVLGLGIDPAMVHLIPEGVDTAGLAGLRAPEVRGPARSRLGLRDEDICGMTAASLHVRKGHDVLLSALRRIRLPAGRRIVWICAGDGPEREPLQRASRDLPDPVSLRLVGQVADVRPLLSAADLFCLPSRYEGLGVALLEAMAGGVPCIASRVGGMAESLVDGETGLHVEVGDAAGLARAIEALIGDPVLASRLADAGRIRTAEHFDVRLMGDRTAELYRRVAQRPDGPRA